MSTIGNLLRNRLRNLNRVQNNYTSKMYKIQWIKIKLLTYKLTNKATNL